MDLKQTLTDIATALEVSGLHVFDAGSVFYGDDFETNARAADEADYPLCQLVPVLAAGADISQRTGRARRRWNVFIFLCDKQPHQTDATAEQNYTIIEDMTAAGLKYVADMNATGLFDFITTVEFKNVVFKFDATVAGVLMYFKAQEKTGTTICE